MVSALHSARKGPFGESYGDILGQQCFPPYSTTGRIIWRYFGPTMLPAVQHSWKNHMEIFWADNASRRTAQLEESYGDILGRQCFPPYSTTGRIIWRYFGPTMLPAVQHNWKNHMEIFWADNASRRTAQLEEPWSTCASRPAVQHNWK